MLSKRRISTAIAEMRPWDAACRHSGFKFQRKKQRAFRKCPAHFLYLFPSWSHPSLWLLCSWIWQYLVHASEHPQGWYLFRGWRMNPRGRGLRTLVSVLWVCWCLHRITTLVVFSELAVNWGSGVMGEYWRVSLYSSFILLLWLEKQNKIP